MTGSDKEEGRREGVVDTKIESLDKKVERLETNQRWGVLTILGLLLKAAFEYFQKGQS